MTMTLIQTSTLGSAAANITLSSIPQTYTDLYLVYSLRSSDSAAYQKMTFNGSSANFTQRELNAGGSTYPPGSTIRSDGWIRESVNPSTATSNTFASAAIYIPNYTGSTNKSFSVDAIWENNAGLAGELLGAGHWSNTAAITSIVLGANANFDTGSTATLYGILKGSGGATVS